MGEIADKMINGELCQWCGVYLNPGETVYLYDDTEDTYTPYTVPNGGGLGVPAVCKDCQHEL